MFDISSIVSRICYLLTVLFNSTLIYLTCNHTKEIVGTYRNMLVTFAVIGIVFSMLDILVRPMFHMYNGCLLFFTLGNSFRFSKTLSEISLLIYCGTYSSILGFLTVQFIYRASVLVRPQWTKHFAGWKLGLWVVYAFAMGILWSLTSTLGYPDQFAYDYLRAEILEVYGLEVQTVPGYTILAYNGKMSFENIRWKCVTQVVCYSVILLSQYSIVLYAGISMYRNIKGNMNTSSSYYERLQKQFFMTLVYQVSAPSLIFHAPAFVVCVAPFFDFRISFHSQIVVYCFSVYPLVDSLIVLCVISEYKHAWKRCVHWLMKDIYECMGGDTPRPPPSNFSQQAIRLTQLSNS